MGLGIRIKYSTFYFFLVNLMDIDNYKNKNMSHLFYEIKRNTKCSYTWETFYRAMQAFEEVGFMEVKKKGRGKYILYINQEKISDYISSNEGLNKYFM